MADEASTPAQRRREATAAKLQGAFERMLESPAHRLTVAALAREAGIGRNAIYANHRDYLEALASLQAARLAVAPPEPPQHHRRDQEEAIARLVEERRQLASQNAGLLKRTLDAEARAERLESENARLLRELAKLRRPVILPPKTSPETP
jgi:hypothetical protein